MEVVSLYSVGAQIEALCSFVCRSHSAQLGHKDVTKFKHSSCLPLSLTTTRGEINHSSSRSLYLSDKALGKKTDCSVFIKATR